MMPLPRTVTEWLGKTADSAIPKLVRLRVWDRYEGCCHRCNRSIPTGDAWIIEHLLALINGGENRESNLRLTCSWCKPQKDREDMAIRQTTRNVRTKHLGISKAKGRPMPGTKASGLKRGFDGIVRKR